MLKKNWLIKSQQIDSHTPNQMCVNGGKKEREIEIEIARE